MNKTERVVQLALPEPRTVRYVQLVLPGMERFVTTAPA